MQTDPISRGRGGSIAGERYVETEEVRPPPGWPTTGNEHLSQLREGYLRLLAEELHFGYLRLDDVARGAEALALRMQQRPLARVAPTRVSLRPLFGLIALLALVWTYRAAVLDRVLGRTMQTRQPGQFEPTRV
jgi:mxaL protein